jgi:hypothetical protein
MFYLGIGSIGTRQCDLKDNPRKIHPGGTPPK